MLKDFPVIKLTILLAAGYLLQFHFNFPLIYPIILISLFLLIFCFQKYIGNINPIYYFLPIAIGALYFGFTQNLINKYPFNQSFIKNAVIFGKINDISLINDKDLKLEITSDSIKLKNTNYNKIQYILNIKSENQKKLKYYYYKFQIGNSINLTGNIYEPPGLRNFNGFNYKQYLLNKNISGIIAFNADKKDINIISNNVDYFRNMIYKARKSIDDKISVLYNKTSSALVRGLLLGDRSGIDDSLQQNYIKTGVVHVLAVSGLHVGLIIFIFFLLFGRLNIILKNVFSLIGIIFYFYLTGCQPSVFRASVMGIVVIICNLSGRSYSAINALFLSGFVILIFNPMDLFNAGFQLSFFAVLSILIYYPKFMFVLNKLNYTNYYLNKLYLLAAITISAQILTIPFLLIYFHQISLISLIANIIVVPLTSLILLIGMLTVFISYLWPNGALIFSSVNDFMIKSNDYFVNLLANNKCSTINIFDFSYYDLFVYFIFITAFTLLFNKMTNFRSKVVFIVIIILNLFIYFRLDNNNYAPPNNLTVIALDVGQGDAFLIKLPNNKTWLIDAGNITNTFNAGLNVILPTCGFLGIDKLDYVFISHIDSDHYLGLTGIIDKIKIGVLYKPKPFDNDKKDKAFENLLIKNKILYKYYKKESINISDAKLYFLTTNKIPQNSNDKSGIIKLVYGKTSFLFTGDAGTKVEDNLINSYGSFLKSNVLKAGHHGSKYSTGDLFLQAVKPQIALISAGIFNIYNLPSDTTISKLKKNNIEILRTDKSGTVILTSTGFEIKKIDWK